MRLPCLWCTLGALSTSSRGAIGLGLPARGDGHGHDADVPVSTAKSSPLFSARHAGRAASVAKELQSLPTIASSAVRHQQPPAAKEDAQAAQYVKVLRVKVEKVLQRIEREKAANETLAAEREEVLGQMRTSLQPCGGSHGAVCTGASSVMDEFLRLHEALAASQHYLQLQTSALEQKEAALKGEIEEEEVSMLYRMLRQRRALPMKSQLAVLRRQQFRANRYAQTLLEHNHDGDSKPLYALLRTMLPKQLASALDEAPAAAGRLAAAGSEGRVRIVSSRIQNSVNDMMDDLGKARAKLAAVANGQIPSASTADRKRAQDILHELDPLMAQARSSHNLQLQLEAMDKVQKLVELWMRKPAKL